MYTDDAVLDINGQVYTGKVAIQGFTITMLKFHPRKMSRAKCTLMTNPRIIVEGDTATAHMIYTETMNDSVYLAPRLIEQGRGYQVQKD